MGRAPRSPIGNIIYHVINRANGRLPIFNKPQDYLAFEKILEEARDKFPMRILAYCLMPNHWHLILWPYHDNDLPKFMRWLTLTHTQRWHTHYHSIGSGHLYQGRYKAFPVQENEYFLGVCRYVERNALRARLVVRAEDWQWSSVWRKTHGTSKDKILLTPWPIEPLNYLEWVNERYSEEDAELNDIRISVKRSSPYGAVGWVNNIATKLGLTSTIRARGRPKKST